MREMDQAEREHWRELLRKPRKKPEDILWMQAHAIVSKVIETPDGKVQVCENFVLVSTPDELEEQKQRLQQSAARLAVKQAYT